MHSSMTETRQELPPIPTLCLSILNPAYNNSIITFDQFVPAPLCFETQFIQEKELMISGQPL